MDASGDLVFRVVRFQTLAGKVFRTIHRSPPGWLPGDPPGLLPLFQLPAIASASQVFVAQGEKVAEAVGRLPGLVATTAADGAKSSFKTDWSPMAGKEIVILPDHGAPGGDFLALVVAHIAGLTPPPIVKVVPLEMIWKTSQRISDSYDIVDWLQCGVVKTWTPAEYARAS